MDHVRPISVSNNRIIFDSEVIITNLTRFISVSIMEQYSQCIAFCQQYEPLSVQPDALISSVMNANYAI